jgi:glycosyltransferase involved in cell wall biosynthesis
LKKPTRKSCLFDVVIPTYNNVRELQACLLRLENQSVRSFRVLACVDGSTDGTVEFLKRARFPYPLILLMHPDGIRKGPACTRNLCLKELSAPYLCMIDSDVLPEPGLLEAHLGLIQKRDVLSVGRIRQANSATHPVAAYLQGRGAEKFSLNANIPSYYLNTQNVAMRSAAFKAVRGFDADFALSYGGDDTELGYRLGKEKGFSAGANSLACVSVRENKTVAFFLGQMRAFGASSLKLIRKKHPEFDRLFGVRWFESRSPAGFLVRLLVQSSLAEALEKLVPFAPCGIRNRMIHLLVFLNMGKGYFSSGPIRNQEKSETKEASHGL